MGIVTWPPEGWASQGETLDVHLPWARRRAAVCVAKSMLGMSTRDAAYISALYPWDKPAVAKQMAMGQHKCGLTAMPVVRMLGDVTVDDGKRYGDRFQRKGPVPADAMTQLQMLPAWRRGDIIPQPGDIGMVWMPGSPKLTHAFTCIEHGDDELTSVDGHYGVTKVSTCTYQIVRMADQVWLVGKGLRRRILGIVSVGDLACSREWLLPVGVAAAV